MVAATALSARHAASPTHLDALHAAILPFLSVDRRLGLEGDSSRLLSRLTEIANRIESSLPPATTDHERVRRVVEAVAGEGGLSPSSAAGWREGTVTHALATGRGTCAALAALSLAVADGTGVSLRLVVIGAHVVVADPADPARAFELLEGGRSTSLAVVSRRTRSGGPPVTVRSVKQFLPFYWDQLAVRASEGGNADAAETAFGEAIELAPRSWRLRFNFGTHLLEAGRPHDASRELKRATRLGCPLADCWSNLGVAQSLAGNEDRAVRSFERALSIDPDHADARRNLAALRRPTCER